MQKNQQNQQKENTKMHQVYETKIKQVSMKTDTFIKLPDHPAQRDTKRHAKMAAKHHLKELSASHLRVAIAQLGDKKFKVDGHTRSYLWEKEFLEKPSHVLCDIYHVKDEKDLIDLYKHFDNPKAAETATDRLAGAFRLHGVPRDSLVWAGGGGSTALKTCYAMGTTGSFSRIEIADCVQLFKKSLTLLNRLETKHGMFPAPVLAVLIASCERDGAFALSFWEGYAMDMGKKNPKSFDPVYAMSQYVQTTRASGGFSRGSHKSMAENMPQLMEIYDAWAGGLERLKAIPKTKKTCVQKFYEWLPELFEKTPRGKAILENPEKYGI